MKYLFFFKHLTYILIRNEAKNIKISFVRSVILQATFLYDGSKINSINTYYYFCVNKYTDRVKSVYTFYPKIQIVIFRRDQANDLILNINLFIIVHKNIITSYDKKYIYDYSEKLIRNIPVFFYLFTIPTFP